MTAQTLFCLDFSLTLSHVAPLFGIRSHYRQGPLLGNISSPTNLIQQIGHRSNPSGNEWAVPLGLCIGLRATVDPCASRYYGIKNISGRSPRQGSPNRGSPRRARQPAPVADLPGDAARNRYGLIGVWLSYPRRGCVSKHLSILPAYGDFQEVFADRGGSAKPVQDRYGAGDPDPGNSSSPAAGFGKLRTEVSRSRSSTPKNQLAEMDEIGLLVIQRRRHLLSCHQRIRLLLPRTRGPAARRPRREPSMHSRRGSLPIRSTPSSITVRLAGVWIS